jgi:hypothetical protein
MTTTPASVKPLLRRHPGPATLAIGLGALVPLLLFAAGTASGSVQSAGGTESIHLSGLKPLSFLQCDPCDPNPYVYGNTGSIENINLPPQFADPSISIEEIPFPLNTGDIPHIDLPPQFADPSKNIPPSILPFLGP